MSSPAVYKGVVYVGSRDNSLYALNAATGDELWHYATGGWVDSSPAVSGNAVYFSSADGYLYAADRATGAPLWRAALGAASVSSPLVVNGRVFVGAGIPEKKLKVFDAATGRALGEVQTAQAVESAPSSDGRNVYFGSNDGRVYALNAASLVSPWAAPYQTTGGSFRYNAVAVSSGTLYALPGHDERALLAIEASAASSVARSADVEAPAWDLSWEQFSSPVVAENRVYFAGGALADSLYAADKGTLALDPWAAPAAVGGVSEFGYLSSPAMAGEYLYLGADDGTLLAVSSAGVSSAEASVSDSIYSSPAVVNGMVYFASRDGAVYAYKAAKAAAISAPEPYAIVSGTVPVLAWLHNASMTGYSLEYGAGEAPSSWTLISSAPAAAEVAGDTLAYWNTGGLPNGLYSLRLTSQENPAPAGGNTALLPVRVNLAPAAPSGLAAADVPNDAGNKIRLSWTASPTAGLSAYRIYRSTGGAYSLLDETSPAALVYVDSAAVTGTLFTYTVRAYDGYLESVDSSTAAARAVNNDPSADVTPPSAVADLYAVHGSTGGRAVLSWTAPGNDGVLGSAAGYAIRYSTDPAYDWSAFGAAQLWKSSRPVSGPYGTAETETVSGLRGGATYYFALKAYDLKGNLSPLSNLASAWAAVGNTVPQAPSALAVADTLGDHGGSLTLNWALSPDDAAGAPDFYGYRVYRRTQTTAYVSTSPYAEVAAGAAKYIDASAPANVRFYYKVSAFNSSRESAPSGEAYGVSADNWRFFDSAQGGSLRLADGAVITIPKGAASQNDSILAVRLDPVTYQPLMRADSLVQANPTGIVYRIEFENPSTRLLRPALLTIPYTPAETAGMKEENLRLYTLSSGVWTLVNTSRPDTAARTVTAEVGHFSLYAVMEYVPSGALLSGDAVYTYPNPAKGDALTFKFLPAYDAFVKIDVYNVAGERVARLEKAGCPAGVTSEIVWKIAGVASGVYEYRLEARSAAGTKSVVKRLAIIH
jgi:outer membrane protein assembly factor BamB